MREIAVGAHAHQVVELVLSLARMLAEGHGQLQLALLQLGRRSLELLRSLERAVFAVFAVSESLASE